MDEEQTAIIVKRCQAIPGIKALAFNKDTDMVETIGITLNTHKGLIDFSLETIPGDQTLFQEINEYLNKVSKETLTFKPTGPICEGTGDLAGIFLRKGMKQNRYTQ